MTKQDRTRNRYRLWRNLDQALRRHGTNLNRLADGAPVDQCLGLPLDQALERLLPHRPLCDMLPPGEYKPAEAWLACGPMK